MISFLRGRVHDKQPNRVTVDVGGVGYEVHVPLSTFYSLGDEGEEISLRVHTHVREDALQLYGFLTELEREERDDERCQDERVGSALPAKRPPS